MIEELAECGFSCLTFAWVLSFLDGHLVTVIIDGKRTATYRITDKGAPQGSALSVIIFLIVINRLLRRLASVPVSLSWRGGFVDDVNFSTASRSILENVRNLEIAGAATKQWEQEDEARFESKKTDLLHMTVGRADHSHAVRVGQVDRLMAGQESVGP